MDPYHPIALILYGALAGGLIVGLAVWARGSAKRSAILVKTRADMARLQENADHQAAELAEKDTHIERLEKNLEETEAELFQIAQKYAAAEARLEQIVSLQKELTEHVSAFNALSDRYASLKEKHTELETILHQERKSNEEKLAVLHAAREELTHTFEAISAKALKNSQESFLELAKVSFSKEQEMARQDLEKRQEAVSQIVDPIRKTLDKYDKQVLEMERMREKAYGSLSQQVQSLARTQQQLHKETAELVKALRTPQIRGRWGEITLRRVAELAGMINYCDFTEQQSRTSEQGLLRPDMIVRLPNDRHIVVDSKVPLMAFLEALETTEEKERAEKLRLHAKQVKAHMHELSRKSYWEQFQPTPEFVVLFIPGENFFSAALEQSPGLIEEGVEKGVVLATPTTLISLLKAIAFGWRQETMAQNAEHISALGMALYERIATMADHLDNLGKQIERCAALFNQTVGSFERRVLVAARRFHDLGVEKKGVEIPHITVTEKHVRKIIVQNDEKAANTGTEEKAKDSSYPSRVLKNASP